MLDDCCVGFSLLANEGLVIPPINSASLRHRCVPQGLLSPPLVYPHYPYSKEPTIYIPLDVFLELQLFTLRSTIPNSLSQ